MEKVMSDWKTPGCAIGIVKGGKLVYAKGFGYRDLEKKLPVTPNTLFAIGSDTKLFTATAVGFLVNEGKLDWDKPIKSFVPEIQFHNDNLNASITLRDMLSHRTGLRAFNQIASGSNFTRAELFEKLKYIEPGVAIREKFIYNNMMYMAAGQIIKIKTGKTWEEFLKEKLLIPLEMKNTVFSIEEMEKTSDYAKPYLSNFVEGTIKPIDFYRQYQGLGPAGSINSNVNDLANWVICQLAKGNFKNNEIIPVSVIDETYTPASFSDVPVNDKEISYRIYGMGRDITTYKGHLMSDHSGVSYGFISQITIFPDNDLGIIFLSNSIGQSLYRFLPLEIADMVLGLKKTSWHERYLARAQKDKADEEVAKENTEKAIVKKNSPSYNLKYFVGEYKNSLYGKIHIKLYDDKLYFHFNSFHPFMSHVQNDQFETLDDGVNDTYKIS